MTLFVDIKKNIGSFCLNVNFEAGDETIALLGASGCGKSMTLRCIAGIEKPDHGKIIIDGITQFDSEQNINLPPQERRTGLLFQNFALFPNMTVLQNLHAGARREKNMARRKESISEILDLFDLSSHANHYPSQLSGGQQQRTALARSLISGPRILLLDEPFSTLDSHLRFRLERELSSVIKRFGKTVVLVSHDREEVYRLADSIAIMRMGQIETCGKTKNIFHTPTTRNGALLTGYKNISRITRKGEHHVHALDWDIPLKLTKPLKDEDFLTIRMGDICKGEGENTFGCSVIEAIENPFSYTVLLKPHTAHNRFPIHWEVDKSTWTSMREDHINICLPPESLLTLKE